MKQHELYGTSPAIKRYSGFGSVLFELIEGTCSKGVSANQTGLPAFPLVIVSQLQQTQQSEYRPRTRGTLPLYA